ncbi:MAG: UbiA family prenyltransferase [Myxococcaceae bacterium]
MKWLSTLSELVKVRISVVSTLSAVTGFAAAAHGFSLAMLWACVGVFLLACGASALNEVQEHRLDAMMERTRNRPIPSGRLGVGAALALALGFAGAGFALLWALFGPTPALLGLSALAWYNGAYTYMKRVTAFAVVPGSIIGAIPPAIGWTAGGGELLDPRLAALAFFFFIWQVPHFWLLLFRLGKDYENAGFPTLTQLFSIDQLGRLTFTWMVATAVSCLLIPIFGLSASPWVGLAMAASGAWLCVVAARLLKAGERLPSLRLAFRDINVFALLVMALVTLDAVLPL